MRGIKRSLLSLLRDQRQQFGVANDGWAGAIDLKPAQRIREDHHAFEGNCTPCYLLGDALDGSAIYEPLVPLTPDHTPIVLCFDSDDSARTNKHVVNVASVARQRDVVYQIEVVRQACEEAADEIFSSDAFSVASGPRILTEGRSSPCESKQKSENRMQDESYDDGPAASGHEDAEKIQKITPLLARQVWSVNLKNLQRQNPFAGMVLLGHA